MNNDQQLSRRERQIMDVLHAKGQATVADVLANLPEPPGYSAVRALLRILEEKGHVRHHRDGARFVYVSSTLPEIARRSALKRVVSTFFQGSVAQTMATLLETADTKLSESDLSNLQQLIEKARKDNH
jgi:predicted transcriptional regulator